METLFPWKGSEKTWGMVQASPSNNFAPRGQSGIDGQRWPWIDSRKSRITCSERPLRKRQKLKNKPVRFVCSHFWMLEPTRLQISYTFWTSSPSKKLSPGIAHLGASLFAPNVFESMWRCVNEASNVHGDYAKICSIPKKIEKQNPALKQFVMNYILRILFNLFGDYISDTTDITHKAVKQLKDASTGNGMCSVGDPLPCAFLGLPPCHIFYHHFERLSRNQPTKIHPPIRSTMLAFGCKKNGRLLYILHAVTSVYTPTIPPKKSSKNSAIFDPFGHEKMDGSPWRIQGRVTNSSCWTCRLMLPGGSQHGGPCWWSDDLNTRPMDTGEQRWKTIKNDEKRWKTMETSI